MIQKNRTARSQQANQLPGCPSARMLMFDHAAFSGSLAKCYGVIRFRYSESCTSQEFLAEAKRLRRKPESLAKQSGFANGPEIRRSIVCVVLACACGKPFFPEWEEFLKSDRAVPGAATKVRMLHCGCKNSSGVATSALDHWLQQVSVRNWPKNLRILFLGYLKKSGRLREYELAEKLAVKDSGSSQKKFPQGLEYISNIRAGDPLSVKQFYGLDFLQTGSVEDGIGFRIVQSRVSGYVCRCRFCFRTTVVSPGNFRSAKSCGCQKRKNLIGKKYGKMLVIGHCSEDVLPFTGHRWLSRCEICQTEIPLHEDSLKNFKILDKPCMICQRI